MVKQFRILAYMFQYLLQRLAFAIFTANEDKRAASDRATQDSQPGAAVWNRKAKKLQQALIERWVGVYAG